MKSTTRRILWVGLPLLGTAVVVRLLVAPPWEGLSEQELNRFEASQRLRHPPTTAEAARTRGPNIDHILRGMQSSDAWSQRLSRSMVDRLSPSFLPAVQEALNRHDLTPETRRCLEEFVRLVPQREHEQKARNARVAAARTIKDTPYLQIGRRNALWDAKSLSVMDRWYSAVFENSAAANEQLRMENAELGAMGCDDPLLIYLCGRSQDYWDTSKQVAAHARREAAANLVASKYPPLWRCWAAFDAARYAAEEAKPGGPIDPQVTGYIETGMQLLPGIIKDPKTPREAIVLAVQKIGDCSRSALADRMSLCQRVLPMLEKDYPNPSTVLMARGLIYKAWAADLRDRDSSVTASPEADRDFRERLAKSAQWLEQAWTADNANDFAACAMEAIVIQQERPREEVEKWFARTVQANPDCYAACEMKLAYLRQHASTSEVLAFGRDCHSGHNWHAGIPLILLEAHVAVARDTLKESGQYATCDYVEQHAETWDEIRNVCFMSRKGPSMTYQMQLRVAVMGALTGDWAQVRSQFDDCKAARPTWDTSDFPDDLITMLWDQAGRRTKDTPPKKTNK